MGLRFKILIAILSIVLLYAFYYFAIPKIINTVQPDISKFVQKKYDVSIKIKNPEIKMSLAPAIWLKAEEFSVLNPDNTNALYIKSPVLKVSLLPLIIGKVEIKYFKGKNLIADINYDNDFVVYLGKYNISETIQDNINFNNIKVYIDNYKVNSKNISNNKILTLNGNYFNVDKYKKNKFLKMSLYSKLISNKNQSNINLNIETKLPFKQHLDDYPPKLVSSVTNLNLSDISDFIKFYTKGKISNISGIVNYEGHSANNFEGQKEYSSYFLIDKPYISSDYLESDYKFNDKIGIYYNLLLSKNTLSIPDIAIKTDKLSLKISGIVNDISSTKSKPYLNISMYQTKFENLLEILPCFKFIDKHVSVAQMKKLNIKSDVNVNINIKNTFEKPYLYGYLNLSNTRFNNKKEISDIKFQFYEESLKVESQTVFSKEDQIILNGKMKIYTPRNAEFKTKSLKQVDLGDAKNYLVILHDIFNFKISPIEFINPKGKGNFDLKINGNKNNFSINGNIEGKNLDIFINKIKDAHLSNSDFNAYFKNKESYFKIENAKLKNSPVYMIGKYNLGKDFEIKGELKNQNLGYLYELYKNNFNKQKQTKYITKLNGNADIKFYIKFFDLENIKNIQLGDNLEVNALAHLNNTDLYFKKYNISDISGDISLKNYNTKINLNTQIANSNVKLDGNINKDIANINFDMSKLPLFDFIKYFKPSKITTLKSQNDYSYIKLAGNYKGSLKHINPKNIDMNGHVFFKNFNFIYNKNKLPVNIISGYTYLNGNSLYLNKLNMQMADMPVIFDGKINNLFKQPYIEAYISSKPKQRFVDFIYNRNSVYPVKLKGDMSCTSFISGDIDKHIKMNTNIKLDEDASIYYMGSFIGEKDLPVNLIFETEYTPKSFIINSIKYNKLIKSQNRQHHSENQLQTTGSIKIQNKKIYFDNFKIKTSYPADTKLFNILFKKSIIKTGQFTSNIIMNGEMPYPKLNGEIKLTGTNIPFFDTSINDMSLNFNPKTVNIEIDGNLISNKFKLNAEAKNSLKPPFVLEKANLKAGNFNVDNILDSIRKNEIENTNEIELYPVKFNNFIVKKLNINADSVQLNTIKAKNLNADVSLYKGDINVKYFKFILAHGEMNGSAVYRHATKKSNFNINVTNADANTLVTSLFDLSGQLYGSLNGNMDIACIYTNKHNCLKTLAGNANFDVKDGRMPKLGSIEYLLKAGNLLKSGVTGLSINGIIDLITPLKTGNFDSIKGIVSINNGVTDKLQILSSGKDLSLFMTGEYNFSSYNANMYIFGRLSKKISTMLGPVGNASLNTLFNTIPGVNLNKIENKSLLNEINKLPMFELSNKLYRVFAVDIHGDITGENFVDSFRWIE